MIPGIPHHVTQRDTRREHTLFEGGGLDLYLDLFADAPSERMPASGDMGWQRGTFPVTNPEAAPTQGGAGAASRHLIACRGV